MKTKSFIITIVVVVFSLSLTACQETDILGNASVTSFNKVIEALGDNVTSDDTYWITNAPDNTAKFMISKDYSKTTIDAKVEFLAKPFIDAGLDITKLPPEMVAGDMITIGDDLSDQSVSIVGEESIQRSFENTMLNQRNKIKYHADIGLMGLDIGGGNMFDWAKDTSKNDIDIAFVLNPKPFIDAGVDPNKIDGWVFGKVNSMDANGKKIVVDKFLKPFNLE